MAFKVDFGWLNYFQSSALGFVHATPPPFHRGVRYPPDPLNPDPPFEGWGGGCVEGTPPTSHDTLRSNLGCPPWMQRCDLADSPDKIYGGQKLMETTPNSPIFVQDTFPVPFGALSGLIKFSTQKRGVMQCGQTLGCNDESQ